MIKQRLIAENLSKQFRVDRRMRRSLLSFLLGLGKSKKSAPFKAVDGVSLALSAGELVAIVGKNGSGKSTLLRTLAGIYFPDGGAIKSRGKVVPLIELEVGLKDRLTMADNIFLCGALFGLTKKEIEAKFNDIVEFSGLGQFIATRLYKFSRGMEERLAFSIAVHCDPGILLLDELFSAVDDDFKKKAGDKLRMMAESGAAVIFTSHDLGLIGGYAQRVVWLDGGTIKQEGKEVEKIIAAYSDS